MKSTLSIFVVAVGLLGALAQSNYYGGDDIEWTSTMKLKDGYVIKWYIHDPEYLVMEMHAPTRGWVGIGLTPNGGMGGADIIMGWVDGTGPHVKDLHGVGNTKPVEDPMQNVDFLYAKQDESGTTIRFKREWNTCDKDHDIEITDATARLIFAWGDEDPIDKKTGKFMLNGKYHGPDQRGHQYAFLRRPTHTAKFPDEMEYPDPDVHVWDIRMPNITVLPAPTIYHCIIVKAHSRYLKKKHHMIGWRQLLNPKRTENTHHIIMYECSVPEEDGGTAAVFEELSKDKKGDHCYNPAMVPVWNKHCLAVPMAWSVGADGQMFNEHTGYPIGENHNGATYFMFEIHYDNPKAETWTDDSGFRVFVTDKLRPNDLGVLFTGNRLGLFHTVLPKADSFQTWGMCSSECTEKTFPPEGIVFTHALLHGHKRARNITTRHIRNGVELEPISEDRNFNFDYQQMRTIVPERRVLPGDIILADCDYDTKDETGPVFGGLGTHEEMCLVFMHYYPRIDLSDCRTQVDYKTFVNGLGIRKTEGADKLNQPYRPKPGQKKDPQDDAMLYFGTKIPIFPTVPTFDDVKVKDPEPREGFETVADYLRNSDWDEASTKDVNEQWYGKNAIQYATCTRHGRRRQPLENFLVKRPRYRPYEPKTDPKCEVRGFNKLDQYGGQTLDAQPRFRQLSGARQYSSRQYQPRYQYQQRPSNPFFS